MQTPNSICSILEIALGVMSSLLTWQTGYTLFTEVVGDQKCYKMASIRIPISGEYSNGSDQVGCEVGSIELLSNISVPHWKDTCG